MITAIMGIAMLACTHTSDDPAKNSIGKADFVDVGTVIPTIRLDVRYASSDNFVGRPVTGYKAAKVFISRKAAMALQSIQDELLQEGLSLKIFDAYRPQRAVNDFVRWAADPNDTKTKEKYYPNVKKTGIIPDGYVAKKSGHSRGSTVDLTITDIDDNDLDMGTGWDYLGPESHIFYEHVTEAQRVNRMKLRSIMIRHGFEPYDKEWWHFTLKNEPYPDNYFDFVVE